MNKYICSECGIEFESYKKNRVVCSMKCTASKNKVKSSSLIKQCCTCKTQKSYKEFWKRLDSVNGLHFECIECGSFRNKNRSPEQKIKERLRCRRKKRLSVGLDPDYEGRYKKKANPNVRIKTKKGYIYMFREGHPNSRNSTRPKGRIFEHVFVMSEYLKRPLTKTERVHHKNGVRDDNRIENLELWNIGHPPGQRVEDKILWCIEFLKQYAPEKLVN